MILQILDLSEQWALIFFIDHCFVHDRARALRPSSSSREAEATGWHTTYLGASEPRPGKNRRGVAKREVQLRDGNSTSLSGWDDNSLSFPMALSLRSEAPSFAPPPQREVTMPDHRPAFAANLSIKTHIHEETSAATVFDNGARPSALHRSATVTSHFPKFPRVREVRRAVSTRYHARATVGECRHWCTASV